MDVMCWFRIGAVAAAPLLDEGLSDGEIAGRLFLSARTVSHQMSAVVAKLGARSRAEAITCEK